MALLKIFRELQGKVTGLEDVSVFTTAVRIIINWFMHLLKPLAAQIPVAPTTGIRRASTVPVTHLLTSSDELTVSDMMTLSNEIID
jgi:hypothetical protein